jgi:hypothetical protein
MDRRLFQFGVLLLWLALPLVAVEYRQAWDHLPALMATHFNAAGQANGWMPREESFHFSLWMMGIASMVSTVLLLASAQRKVEAANWGMLGFFALFNGFLLAASHAVVSYNLHGTPVHPERILPVLAIAGIGTIAIYLSSHRHAALPPGETLAVETHSGRAWTLIILVAMVGPVAGLVLASSATLLWPMMLFGVIGLSAVAIAWSGFQYRFLQHGVEVRMLGFRLRSIPRSAILNYAIEPWAFIRGYGIRGVGSTRAYVWGNKVVHIKTSNGDVFLGHNDPEKIVRDLDQVMQAHG